MTAGPASDGPGRAPTRPREGPDGGDDAGSGPRRSPGGGDPPDGAGADRDDDRREAHPDDADAGPEAGDGGSPLGEVEPSGGGRIRLALSKVRRLLSGVPAFGKLLYRLLGDARVSLLDRVIFGAALAYLFVPVDLVPDWIPALGQMDDLLVVAFTLDRLLHRTDEAVLAEHWDGDPASFRALADLLERATDVLPGWARALLRAG